MRFSDTRVCDAYITQQCTQQRGTDACLQELVAAQQQGSGPNKVLIGVLVPVAVVGRYHAHCSIRLLCHA